MALPPAAPMTPRTALRVSSGALAMFGLVLAAVSAGVTVPLDTAGILAFRAAADPSDPAGPAWLQETARDWD